MSELSRTGKSNMLDSLYSVDYEEKPVSFQQFIESPEYLGGTTDNGRVIWESWQQEMGRIFNPLSNIHLVLMSGPIGVGKSTIASYGVCYQIYKLLCLKDPAKYYKLAADSKPGIALFNITLTKAYDVAYYKINSALKKSDWFLRHGEVIGSSSHTQTYLPDKNVTISVGSNAEHFIGLDTFCVAGDTPVLTSNGTFTIEELFNSKNWFKVPCVNEKSEIVQISDWTVAEQTEHARHLFHIVLDNGFTIKCTAYHRWLMMNKRYKYGIDIQVGDVLYSFEGGRTVVEISKVKYGKIPVYDVIDVSPNPNFLVDMGDDYIVSHNCMFQDESNFGSGNKELDITKKKAYETWTAMYRRMESRYMNKGQMPGMAFVVSSVKNEDAFLSQMIEMERGNPGTYILEKPQWEMLPKERFQGDTFHLFVSNKNEEAFIAKANEDISQYNDTDFIHYNVPVEYYDTFYKDIHGALRDIVGKASKTTGRFLVTSKVLDAINPEFKNCFTSDLISLGTLKDGVSLMDYINVPNFNLKLLRYPIFVHHDLSLGSSDNTGLYLTAVANNVGDGPQDKDQYATWKFIPVGWCRIRAERKGEQIPLFKIREGVKELRDKYGFNILGVSADGYQSADMLQQYRLLDFETFMLSMDKAPSHGYNFFRSSLYAGRVILPDCKFLINELTHLVENSAQEKVDHLSGKSSEGMSSKDLSDACAGSMFCAIKYNEKQKTSIFANSDYLYADLIQGYKSTNVTHNEVAIDTTNILNELKSSLFSPMEEDNEDDAFSILY